jgi:hypothetical protein
MAGVLYYIGGSAAAYWLGSNVLVRSANASIDWLLNAQASPEISETHTVKSIHAMLSVYKNLKPRHPAYKAMGEVRDGVRDLQIAIERTKLKYDAHRGGYLSRFRTFDATADNVVIEKKAKDLMERLELFTKLMNLPERAKTPPSPAATDSEDECPFNGLLDPLPFSPASGF